MQHSPRELPGVLIYSVALTVGVLAALAVQMWLSHSGFDLVSTGRELLSAKALQLRTAGPWWAVAGSAFIASGATAAALSRLPLPWRRFRAARWLLSAVGVFALAHLGHAAAAAASSGAHAGASLAVSLAALCIAALTGLLGAYFTARR